MRILVWHLHGAWTTSFVRGGHTYLVPATPARDPYGLGRATTYDWPDSAVEIEPAALRHAEVDVVVLQRPEEWRLAAEWLGRRPGRDVPVVYVEHNTPRGGVPVSRHPMADRDDVTLVHVTHFNRLMWDSGATPTTVVEHGIGDPGHAYSGELPRIATAVNEPVRRWRVTGTDLLPAFAERAPIDVYGMGLDGLDAGLGLPAARLTCHGDTPQAALHAALARRRLYLHPVRWTSLGLALLEAMALGIPAVGLATTEAATLPPDAGVFATDVPTLVDAVGWLLDDPAAARRIGARGRETVLARYGLARFLSDWDGLLSRLRSTEVAV